MEKTKLEQIIKITENDINFYQDKLSRDSAYSEDRIREKKIILEALKYQLNIEEVPDEECPF